MKLRNNIKIATVYLKYPINTFTAFSMDTVRWIRISEGFADKGYQVDMIVNIKARAKQIGPNLRMVPYSQVDWNKYDVIKTLFHCGFKSLIEECKDHPFIISKLGSVVGSEEIEGVHFHNDKRKELYNIQREIAKKSRFVTILTKESKDLWCKEFGNDNVLLVPTGVDKEIPPPKKNPYRKFKERIALFMGNIYGKDPSSGEIAQKDINLMWQHRLNSIGRLLKRKGIRLCFVGMGDTGMLNHTYVTYMGSMENDKMWDYQYYADVGLALAEGEKQHNERSKIYYYLRTGLPVVSEAPIPNNNLIQETGLGFIADYGNDSMIANMVEEAIYKRWNRKRAISYILKNHTWDKRAEIYDRLLKEEFIDKGRK